LRSDPQLRLKDYLDALGFYLRLPVATVDAIVFAENSGADLTPFRRFAEQHANGKQVEFISFPHGNDFPPEYGKGYGEMTLMNYALDKSRLVSPDRWIWKATGRLILSNAVRLIATTPETERIEVYADLHSGLPRFLTGRPRLGWFDPRFYAFKRRGYDSFFRLPEEQLRRANIEYSYYDSLVAGWKAGRITPRLRCQPLISGFSGTVNRPYNSPKKRLQRVVQQALRIAAPRLWL
jgi:hypothetical protein